MTAGLQGLLDDGSHRMLFVLLDLSNRDSSLPEYGSTPRTAATRHSPQSVSLNKPMSPTQPPGVSFGL